MSGLYTFYVRCHTTGSLVESVYNYLILTNSPGLIASNSITMTGIATSSVIGHLSKSPVALTDFLFTLTSAYFAREYAVSGSWVAETTFIAFGAANEPDVV